MVHFFLQKRPELGVKPENSYRDLRKLGNPYFLAALVILITNDWVLKPLFHNAATGKLSDFAGLFAFPFACSAIFPRWKRGIHLSTVLLFIFWKSEYANPVLEFLNNLNIPVHRTPDPTDLLALVSVVASMAMWQTNQTVLRKRLALNAIMVLATVSFIATTIPYKAIQHVAINKTYHFNVSKRNLVAGLNTVIVDEMSSIMKGSAAQIDFDGSKNIFHFHGSTDTLAQIVDYNTVEGKTRISYRSSFADMVIEGNEHSSSLTLVRIARLQRGSNQTLQREKAIRIFERRVIEKVRRFSSSLPNTRQ